MGNLVEKISFFFGLNKNIRGIKRVVRKRDYPKRENQILIEAWMNPAIVLGLERFLPIIADYFAASPISFYGTVGGNWVKLKEWLRLRFSIYSHIGIKRFHLFSFSKKNDFYSQVAIDFLAIYNSPDQFQKIKYRNVLIGDTVYDSFLRGYNVPTLDYNDRNLVEKLANAIYYVDALYSYYEENRVAAVCIIETTYMLALPGRVAFEFGIEVFVITHRHLFRLTKNEYIAFHDFKKYQQLFDSLPEEIKIWGREKAKLTLPSLLKEASFNSNSQLSFSHFAQGRLYHLKQPLKLLVSAHDFFDSPHRVGFAFYPDFYTWLEFLRTVATQREYQWFIRPHPNARKWNTEVLTELFKDIPSVTLLSPRLKNSELLKMDFSAVLTVFGTVGCEWPLFGVPVINACSNHKHKYIFGNITPSSKDEYENLLFNLNSMEFYEVNSKESLIEYLFMRDFYMPNSFTTRCFKDVIDGLGLNFERAKKRGFGWEVAHKILLEEQYSEEILKSGFHEFIKSEDYFLNRTHLGLQSRIVDFEHFV